MRLHGVECFMVAAFSFFFFFPGLTVTLKILFSSNDNDVLISPVTMASNGFDISGIKRKRKAAFRCSCCF